MESRLLYKKLERSFIKKGLSDDWASHMDGIKEFLTEEFKGRSMGLVCDNTNEIKKVYTAVFPTNDVMRIIIYKGHENVLLLTHHPSNWDITKAPEVFQLMDYTLLKEFKKRKISIYNLHVPLDNYGPFGTSKCLAEELGIKISKPFCPYYGSLAGIIGTTDFKTLEDLSRRFRQIIGHRVGYYNYGDMEIYKGRVAVVAGGGFDKKTLEELRELNVKTLITGITAMNDHSKEAHDYAQYHKINVLGGSHYSTEKFAMIRLCNYFKKLGISCDFLNGIPGLDDL